MLTPFYNGQIPSWAPRHKPTKVRSRRKEGSLLRRWIFVLFRISPGPTFVIWPKTNRWIPCPERWTISWSGLKFIIYALVICKRNIFNTKMKFVLFFFYKKKSVMLWVWFVRWIRDGCVHKERSCVWSPISVVER